jgi:hypothetical protein
MCRTCRRRIVEIDVRIGDATVTMHACSSCETRWWDRDGRVVGLATVLALAAESPSALEPPAE